MPPRDAPGPAACAHGFGADPGDAENRAGRKPVDGNPGDGYNESIINFENYDRMSGCISGKIPYNRV
ncbi:hypothetical protein D5274_11935 [bacterium 1XD42-94]|nr:hypothetical protein [bacterium 1XD42-76]NBK05835.1 hypothetical protein [bacterium 1XD42-94]